MCVCLYIKRWCTLADHMHALLACTIYTNLGVLLCACSVTSMMVTVYRHILHPYLHSKCVQYSVK